MATNPVVHDENQINPLTQKPWDPRISPHILPRYKAILQAALDRKTERSFGEALAEMPNVGEDSDFAPPRG